MLLLFLPLTMWGRKICIPFWWRDVWIPAALVAAWTRSLTPCIALFSTFRLNKFMLHCYLSLLLFLSCWDLHSSCLGKNVMPCCWKWLMAIVLIISPSCFEYWRWTLEMTFWTCWDPEHCCSAKCFHMLLQISFKEWARFRFCLSVVDANIWIVELYGFEANDQLVEALMQYYHSEHIFLPIPPWAPGKPSKYRVQKESKK